MEPWLIAILVKPLWLFAFFILCAFVRVATQKWFPNCRLKTLLLTDTDDICDLIARSLGKEPVKRRR